MNKYKIIFFFTCILCTSYLFANKGGGSARDTSTHVVELRNGNYNLINPLLDCYQFNHSGLKELIEIEDLIHSEVKSQIQSKNAGLISVYYRELNNGNWVGENENEKYSPASLLKLPVLIAALKHQEKFPGFLQSKVKIDTTVSSYIQILGNNNFSLTVGKEYTIEELLECMIIYSDNQSKDIVLQRIQPEILKNVFYDLGIDIFKYHNFEKSLSVKEYATYFRILYNATYLSKENSNKALEILSKTRFKLGLVAGLPDSVYISHKFGERDFGPSKQKQLHDCGIIYADKNPYILCVMAVGYDYTSLANAIATISKKIYNLNRKQTRMQAQPQK